MRANRVRMLSWLSEGGVLYARGRGHMVHWLEAHGLVERNGRGGWAATEQGRREATKAVADYDARGRLAQVFPPPGGGA